MKVTLSKQQMCELLSRALLTHVTDFVIQKEPVNLATRLERGMSQQMGAERPFPDHRKIEAIKCLRTLSSTFLSEAMGLAEAKWAIENWTTWIGFVRVQGRIPRAPSGWYGNNVQLI